MNLSNQIALVTGASQGIGSSIAIELASKGAFVFVNFKNHKQKALEVVKTIEEMNGQAQVIEADTTDEIQVKQMFQNIVNTKSRLDILVNNTGIQNEAALIDMTLDQWEDVIKTNLTSQFLCTKEAIILFLSQPKNNDLKSIGKIVSISSVHDKIPWARHSNYSASKAGLLMFVKSIAQEYAKNKIRINAVSPGAIKTSINEKSWEDPKKLRDLMDLIPYERMGETKDIANTVSWLVSDESDYINGTTIYVDGGMSLYKGFESGG